MRICWNWQTGTFEGRVPYGVWVQVPLSVPMQFSYRVTEETPYQTIKQLLKEEWDLSRNLILRLKTHNQILLNQQLAHVNCNLNYNDLVEINLDFDEDNSNIVPTNIPLDIIHEDSYYLVLNKPSNIAIHPTLLHYDNSLSNGVKHYFDTIRSKEKNPSC